MSVALTHPAQFADVSGKLRIWDTTQKEHLLKYVEYQPFAGKIKDIAWTEDSKRIGPMVGEGREKESGLCPRPLSPRSMSLAWLSLLGTPVGGLQ